MSDEPESDGELLARLGMDGDKWARELCARNPILDLDTVRSWLCNAIMAGYDEGCRRTPPPRAPEEQALLDAAKEYGRQWSRDLRNKGTEAETAKLYAARSAMMEAYAALEARNRE